MVAVAAPLLQLLVLLLLPVVALAWLLQRQPSDWVRSVGTCSVLWSACWLVACQLEIGCVCLGCHQRRSNQPAGSMHLP